MEKDNILFIEETKHNPAFTVATSFQRRTAEYKITLAFAKDKEPVSKTITIDKVFTENADFAQGNFRQILVDMHPVLKTKYN